MFGKKTFAMRHGEEMSFHKPRDAFATFKKRVPFLGSVWELDEIPVGVLAEFLLDSDRCVTKDGPFKL